MRKLAFIPLLALLAACTDRGPIGPGDQEAGDIVAAKGGIPGPPDKDKPPEEPPPALPADPAIAFNTYNAETGYCLRVMNDDGSNDTGLICGSGVLSPSWSPDGTSIAFTKRWYTASGHYELWRMDVRVVEGVLVSSENGPLASPAGEPAWSPMKPPGFSSEIIAYPEAGFVDDVQRNFLRYICPEDGDDTCSGILYTAAEGVTVQFPAWSPDASSIAIVETETSESGPAVWRIKIHDLNTTGAVTVFDGGDQFTEIWDLDWSRTGDRLAFAAGTASGKGRKGKGTQDVYTLGVSQGATGSWQRGTLTQVIEGIGPSWSPHDAYLVVTSERNLVKINLITDYATETLRQGGLSFNPDWRRDPPGN